MALGGKVFDVTRYIDYHPGGRDELLRGAGVDATALFLEVCCVCLCALCALIHTLTFTHTHTHTHSLSLSLSLSL